MWPYVPRMSCRCSSHFPNPFLFLLRSLPAPWGHSFQEVGRSLYFFLRYELMISLILSPGYTFMPAEHDTCPLHTVGPPPGIRLMLWLGITQPLLWKAWLHFGLRFSACQLLQVTISSSPLPRIRLLAEYCLSFALLWALANSSITELRSTDWGVTLKL